MKKGLLVIIESLVILMSLISCSGKLQKTWHIKEFNEERIFKIDSEKGKSYNTAIVTVTGNIDENVCFILEKNGSSEWCNYFSSQDSKIQFKTDFYGVGTFKLYMLPSLANGNLKLTIELPYNESLF